MQLAVFAALFSREFTACALFGFCLALFHIGVLCQVVIAKIVARLRLSRTLGAFRGGAFANLLLGKRVLSLRGKEEHDCK